MYSYILKYKTQLLIDGLNDFLNWSVVCCFMVHLCPVRKETVIPKKMIQTSQELISTY